MKQSELRAGDVFRSGTSHYYAEILEPYDSNGKIKFSWYDSLEGVQSGIHTNESSYRITETELRASNWDFETNYRQDKELEPKEPEVNLWVL